MSARAGIFDEDDLDLSGFAPSAAAPRPGPPVAAVRAVSEQARFQSREPAAAELPKAVRRHRTGRNRQINIKASDRTIGELYAIADANGWVLGETLERALEALKRELAAAPR